MSTKISPRWLLPLLGMFLLASNKPWMMPVSAKEIEATKEWQLLGENDTVAAGMHIRIDMTTGEKWVKLPDDEEDEKEEGSMTTSTSSSNAMAAIIQPDGSVEVKNSQNDDGDKEEANQYDYDMMYRTLSKLPPEEMQRYGGLPQLPETNKESRRVLTAKERQAFEARMAQIWEQRQAELREVQAMLMDLPEVLKERIRGIQEYLREPLEQLRKVDLYNEEADSGTVTDIISLLKDLEFQLTDVDNARDFHTLGGWELLVSLLDESSHVQNKTISKLSRSTEGKIRAVQAHAAWTIGTAVKNTGEFFPYAVERVKIGAKTTTTALDMLLDVFCQNYKDQESWPIRILREKSIYAIGSLLRGNRLSQAHLIQNQGASRLSDKLQQLVQGNTSFDAKLVQRLMSLPSDIIMDIQLDGEESTAALNKAVIEAFTTSDWCNALSTALVTETFLPVRVQETIMEAIQAMAPYCISWKEKSQDHKSALERFQKEWKQNEADFDPEHLKQLNEQLAQTTCKVV